jgi:TPR repeat protein
MVGVSYAQGQGMAKDESKAAQWYLAAAAQGHADAQYILGIRAHESLRRAFALSVLIDDCEW